MRTPSLAQYVDCLDRNGLTYLRPTAAERDAIDHIIMTRLV